MHCWRLVPPLAWRGQAITAPTGSSHALGHLSPHFPQQGTHGRTQNDALLVGKSLQRCSSTRPGGSVRHAQIVGDKAGADVHVACSTGESNPSKRVGERALDDDSRLPGVPAGWSCRGTARSGTARSSGIQSAPLSLRSTGHQATRALPLPALTSRGRHVRHNTDDLYGGRKRAGWRRVRGRVGLDLPGRGRRLRLCSTGNASVSASTSTSSIAVQRVVSVLPPRLRSMRQSPRERGNEREKARQQGRTSGPRNLAASIKGPMSLRGVEPRARCTACSRAPGRRGAWSGMGGCLRPRAANTALAPCTAPVPTWRLPVGT